MIKIALLIAAALMAPAASAFEIDGGLIVHSRLDPIVAPGVVSA